MFNKSVLNIFSTDYLVQGKFVSKFSSKFSVFLNNPYLTLWKSFNFPLLCSVRAEAIKILCTWCFNQHQTTTHPQKVHDGDLEFTKIISCLQKIFIWTICLHCSSEWTDSLVFRNWGEANKNYTDLLQGMLFLKTPSALNITLLF